MKIAVVGAGISGLSAAYYLSKKHKVDLFEKENQFGGHANTIKVAYNPNKEIPIDIGFMVFNKQTYPNLINFFLENKIEIEKSDMSFSEPLKINKYGIPEPEAKNIVYPDVLLIPLVAFDKNLNRLGYGGGYYDRLIEKLSKKKNIIKIGLAFSIQEIDKVPTNMYDQKLDYIVTNKNIIK
ncbi:5-formyltetrahydrofolate cyclo-ligase [Candidatus Pelagibacter ubique]|nr:5-formyltetrahydrofolate cyclo-ligase [Candidatus Pelagibacter ubique]